MVSIIFEPIVSGKLLGHPNLFTLCLSCLCCSLVNKIMWSLPEICPKIYQSFAARIRQRPDLHGKSERWPQSCGKVTTALQKGLPELCQRVCHNSAADFARALCGKVIWQFARICKDDFATALPKDCCSFAKEPYSNRLKTKSFSIRHDCKPSTSSLFSFCFVPLQNLRVVHH